MTGAQGGGKVPDMPAHPEVPTSEINRANAKLARMATLQAKIAETQARLDGDVALLVETAQFSIQAALEELAELETDLTGFATKHRKPLTRNGRTKTIKLPAGILSWKDSVLSITIDDESELLAALKVRGWIRRFTKVSRTPIKDKMKKYLDDIRDLPGITVNEPVESFVVKPTQLKLNVNTKLKTEPTKKGEDDQR